MNKRAHSRTHTEFQPMASSIMSKVAQCSGVRIKTTPSQLNYNWTVRSNIGRKSGFQEAHMVTVSKAKQLKAKERIGGEAEGEDYSSKYILERIIGGGAFGVVYKAHSCTQHRLAVKKVAIKDDKNKELIILKSLHHPNILKIIDHYFTAHNNHRYLHIVTQHYSHSLQNLIDLKNTQPSLFPLYLYQILRGLVYLKQKDILHRDLTPSNILVESNTHKVVIADFGSAKINHQPHSLLYVVARPYRAP
jgi:mitogen-activated protein kinase 15